MSKNSLLNKGIALIVIVLFIGMSVVSSTAITVIEMHTSEDNGTVSIGGGTEYWALLIGVGVYANSPYDNIPPMLEETDDLFDVLLESSWWSEDHIKVIKGKDATVLNIIKGLRWLDRMDDKDDISLVYFTTHGSPLGFDIPPLDEDDGTDEILVSYWGFAYPGLFIWDDELNFMLNRLDSKGVCLIVDSCFAGGFNDSFSFGKKKSISPNSEIQMSPMKWMEEFAEDVLGDGRVVIMSSREDEVSMARGFSPFLIDGLSGYADRNYDGIVTAEEVFHYSEPRCFWQHPTIYDKYPDELPLLSLYPNISNSNRKTNKYDTRLEFISTHTVIQNYDNNSIVCGYVKDAHNSVPIDHAAVDLNWKDDEGHYDWNNTYSSSSGFYQMNVAAGEILLNVYADGYFNYYTDWFDIDENETLWINISLDPRPPENSIVCGYINDYLTGDPIENADVNLYWEDDEGHYDWNDTYSNVSGFYQMNVAAGEIRLSVYANGYLSEHMDSFEIDDYEILWINFSLVPLPPENSIVCGYVTDSLTGEPIEDADVNLNWEDDEGHYYHNDTYSDDSGFYSMNVAAGEIRLYVYADGYLSEHMESFEIDDYEILWINFSLVPLPPENSIVCGYIMDAETNNPIEDTEIELEWHDKPLNMDWNFTKSDSFGFYSFNVAKGCVTLRFFADGYLFEGTEWFEIKENDILWVNVSLDAVPPETAVVCGYITDLETNESIKDVYVDLEWIDGQGHMYWNGSKGNQLGFYSMNIPPGEVYFNFFAEDYPWERTYRNDVVENERLWINISLRRCINVDITKPLKAMYVKNKLLLPFPGTVILGDIDIEVSVYDYWSVPIVVERVEFYIDNNLKNTVTSEPYIWTWDEKSLLKHKHTITVNTYDENGLIATKEIQVWKFF